jgi:hypothetical protein
VLDLTGHHGGLHIFFVEDVDEAREFAQLKPMYCYLVVDGGALVDLRIGLFANGSDDDAEALRPRCIEQ